MPLLLASELLHDTIGSSSRALPSPRPNRRHHSDTSGRIEAPQKSIVESADVPRSDNDGDDDDDDDSDSDGGDSGLDTMEKGGGGSGSDKGDEDKDEEAGDGSTQPLPPTPQAPPLTMSTLVGAPTVLSVASVADLRSEYIHARQRPHPPPRLLVTRAAAGGGAPSLPWWYRLRVKRLRELKELFHGTTGTALTLLGTTLPFLCVRVCEYVPQ